jgi:ElaB/YqjD/DUF883 family membrane-anchored ribosome-binding protein
MFQYRSSQFDPRLTAIAGHLRAIEKELGVFGRRAGRTAADRASDAGDQIADVLGPILSDIGNRFRRGQRTAVDEVTNFSNEAVRFGAKAGSDALDRIADQAKNRPLFTLAVAVGIGVLIGFASRRE